MFRKVKMFLIVVLSLASLTAFGTFAQSDRIPADAAPGAEGITGAILGGLDPVVAPGYRLVLAELVFDPDTFATEHVHPTAIVFCVQSGALYFEIQQGAAAVTRNGGDPESVAVDTEVLLEPRDCIAFDHFAQYTSHTGVNASDGQTVLWEARLFKTGEPFTVFLGETGSLMPQNLGKPY